MVPLESQGTVTVKGNNLDAGGSNEAGKSALFYPLSNILFSSVPGGVGNKRKSIGINTYEAVLDMDIKGTSYRIEQFFTTKRSGYRIIEDGIDVTPEGGIPMCVKAISEIYPLSEDQHYSMVHISPHQVHVLARGRMAERLAFLHSVFELDEYDALHQLLAERSKSVDSKLARLQEVSQSAVNVASEIGKYPPLSELKHKLKELILKRKETKNKKVDERNCIVALERVMVHIKTFLKIKRRMHSYKHYEDASAEYIKSCVSKLDEKVQSASKVITEWESHKTAISKYRKYKQYTMGYNANTINIHTRRLMTYISQAQSSNQFVLKRRIYKRELSNLPNINGTLAKSKLSKLNSKIALLSNSVNNSEDVIGHYKDLDIPVCPTCGHPINRRKVRKYLRKAEIDIRRCNRQLANAAFIVQRLEDSIKIGEKREKLLEMAESLSGYMWKDIRLLRVKLKKLRVLSTKVTRAMSYKSSLKGFKISKRQYLSCLNSIKQDKEDLVQARDALSLKEQLERLPKITASKRSIKREIRVAKEEINTLENDASVIEQSIANIRNDISKLKSLIRDQKDYEARAQALDKYRRLSGVYKGLLVAYGPRGLKIDRTRDIMSKLAQLINRYSPILFADPIKFSHTINDEIASLMYERRSVRMDVRALSSGASRKLILCVILSLAAIVDPDKRTNIVILDEVDANIDRVGQKVFTDEFLPLMQRRFESVFALTPYNNVIEGSKEWCVEKRLGVSRLYK